MKIKATLIAAFASLTISPPASAWDAGFRYYDTLSYCENAARSNWSEYQCMEDMDAAYAQFTHLTKTARSNDLLKGALEQCSYKHGVEWDAVQACAANQDAAFRDLRDILSKNKHLEDIALQCLQKNPRDLVGVKSCIIQ